MTPCLPLAAYPETPHASFIVRILVTSIIVLHTPVGTVLCVSRI